MICAAGLATVSEILDFEGQWTVELIDTMMPVVADIKASRLEELQRAFASVISAAFSKKSKGVDFNQIMKGAREEVERGMRASRGLDPTPGADVTEQFRACMNKIGIYAQPLKSKKGKKAKNG